MIPNFLYILLSIVIVSLISVVGIVFLTFKTNNLKKILLYLVSLSAGALLGGAFIHLIPEAIEIKDGMDITLSLAILSGIMAFFILEKVIHWRHCHVPTCKDHPHPLGMMNLIGDAVHNFIDGLAIGVGYIVSIPVGVSTTIAVILHEIPQEIGDFGVLLHAGYSKKKALIMNFITALTAVLGAIIAITIGQVFENITQYLAPFAAGGFIYIATADLIPELKKENNLKKSLIQLTFVILGIAIMAALTFLE